MLRLIKSDFAASRQSNPCNGTPSLFVNLRADYALFRERCHLGFQVVAQEIEFVRTVFIGGMERGLAWREGEDQPAMTSIHRAETKNVAEEGAVRFCVFCVDDCVSS